MQLQKISFFHALVGKNYLLEEFGDRDYSRLSKKEKDLVRAISVLCEFQETGSIQYRKEQTSFEGPIGQLMIGYLAHKTSLRLNKSTVDEYEQHLYRFLNYLNKHGITSVNAINLSHMLHFIKGIDIRFSTLLHLTLRSLRGFFAYLYQQKLLNVDLAGMIPKDNYKKQARLPSVYSKKEIEEMITCIDRGNAKGKRNYAIVLLAARLGLRASDIVNLKFNNLYWERSVIIFDQYKTGKKIELPLLPEVGNAIIDYLKYGRPQSEEGFVFLLSRSPYTPMNRCSVTGIVHTALVRAGINIENRKHGAHTLRHSLAGILLENKTMLPVISEVLGHKNTASTKYYLRIDLKSMRQCVMEVLPVSIIFYNQKGGCFYE